MRAFSIAARSIAVVFGLWLLTTGSASATVPAPCGGSAHITDAKGDGHHMNTDVTSAWFSEDETGLRVVIRTAFGDWQPAHDDSEGAGWAFMFKDGSVTRYVRLVAPFTWAGPSSYDYGTWTSAGGFATEGTTTGNTVSGVGGSVTIEIPNAMDLVKGDVLAQTQVLTFDGIESGSPHWVDRAPGGTTPSSSNFGADFVVGTCLPKDPDEPDPEFTTAVQLEAQLTRTGRGKVPISGQVLPARPGVGVQLTITAAKTKTVSTHDLITGDDGRFSLAPVLSESSSFRAVATDNGIASRTLALTMKSKVELKLRRTFKKVKRRGGKSKPRRIMLGRASGRVDPPLPGRILILPVDGIFPVAKTTVTNGRYSIRNKRIRRGR